MSGEFIADSELFSSLCSSSGKNSSAVFRRHSLPETMLVFSFSVAWLICPFHYVFKLICKNTNDSKELQGIKNLVKETKVRFNKKL